MAYAQLAANMFLQNNLNKSCASLSEAIDEKLYLLSNKELNSVKGGMAPINYHAFVALVDYKAILTYVMYSECCINMCIDDITALLRKRLNSLC